MPEQVALRNLQRIEMVPRDNVVLFNTIHLSGPDVHVANLQRRHGVYRE